MGILNTLYDELISFFGIEHWLTMFKTGDYSSLHTLDGLVAAVGPFIPLLLIIELVRAVANKQLRSSHYRVTFFIFVFNRVIGRFISIAAVAFCVGLFQKYAIIKTGFTWYWLIYGYIIWEFAHFIYHYFGHKVRLFWCLHSTHHAPTTMNLSISYAHFFL